MKTIHTRQTVGPDGHIRLDIPVGRAGDELDVLVVLSDVADPADASDWHGFVEQMAGTCPDLELPHDPPPTPLKDAL